MLLLDTHASQAPFMAVHTLAANDATVQRAEAWVRAHIGEEFDVARLARAVGLGQRTLARRLKSAVGMTPIGFVQRLRVELASQLLETTRLSLDEIGARVGYSDASALRRLIQRELRASPRELRRRARAA